MPRLLIVKTSSLGDVIHNLPIISDIRLHYPQMEIDWVVEESFADIPRLHPAVNQVIPVAIRRWRKHLFSRATWQEISRFRQAIKNQAYDAVIDTQGLLKSAWIAACAHGESHGYDKASARESWASVFYQRCHHVARNQHAVARNRALVAESLGYTAPQNPPDYALGNIPASGLAPSGQAYIIGLHASSRDSKLWPIACWQALATELAKHNLQLLLPWGNPQEQARAQSIASASPSCKVLPKLAIRDLASLLSGAQAAVGVDTGLVHLAVALGKPTVAIYTDTNPQLTGVYPAADCEARSLGGPNIIPTVEDVMQHLRQIARI